MRDAEGTTGARPGESLGSTWSEGSNKYIRNVEAVGSNPITSTESPGQGLEVEPRNDTMRRRVFTCLCR